jgi:hypothetical protein
MPRRDYLTHQEWLAVVPSVHGRATFAQAVRGAIDELAPDRIAVELPPALASHLLEGVARLPRLTVVHYQQSARDTAEGEGARAAYVPVDPCDSMIEALRLAMERRIPVEFVDLFRASYEPPETALPDPDLAAEVGVERYVEAIGRPPLAYRDEESRELDRRREIAIAWRVGALRDFGRVLLVCGLAHWHGIREALEQPTAPPPDDETPVEPGLAYLHTESVYGLIGELPFVAADHERARARSGDPQAWRVERALERLIERAERDYEHSWGEEVSRPNRRALRRFAVKLAFTEGSVLPSLYSLVVAAKGCQDDDLAAALYDRAIQWPWPPDEDADLEILRIDPELLRQRFTRIRILRRDPALFGRDRDPTEVFRHRPREGEDENWREEWEEGAFGGCSYVPEDLRQLQWVDWVRHEAPSYLQEQRTVLREFTGNLLDGIDIRETMRNWWRRRIIVREEMRLRGLVGPVVVIYDDEPLDGDDYPCCMVWPGESHDEGDLVLYSTMPGEQLVGPGISRCEYGGFATLPGVHLGWWQDPWHVLPRSGWCETKGELLVLTAALCARETFVAVISRRPLRHAVVQRCQRLGHPLIEIPMASFTPSALKKLRVFHQLAGTGVRAHARDYIEPRPRGFRA